MSAYFHNQPKVVRVEDGLAVHQGRRIGGEGSPCWYRTSMEGTWKDWVDLAKAIIEAEEKRKATS